MSWLQIIIYVLIALYILTVASVVFNVILENRNPVRTLAWIIVLVTVPLVGFLFYLYFGVNYRKNKMFSMKGLGDMKWTPVYERRSETTDPEIGVFEKAGDGRSAEVDDFIVE